MDRGQRRSHSVSADTDDALVDERVRPSSLGRTSLADDGTKLGFERPTEVVVR